MTRTAATSSTTPHGGIAPSSLDFGALYETRHGRCGAGRVLWDRGTTANCPLPSRPPPAALTISPEVLQFRQF